MFTLATDGYIIIIILKKKWRKSNISRGFSGKTVSMD